MKYPIIHIYPTIQGQGPRMGEPMILIRTSTPPEFEEFCYMKTTRKTKFKLMPPGEIAQECIRIQEKYSGIKWVFFGGDDPCIADFTPLVDVLHDNGFLVWLDTTGIFWFDWTRVDHLSIGPKPHLPFIPDAVRAAHDVRLYYHHDREAMWVGNYARVVPFVATGGEIFIAPRVLTQACIDTVIDFVLSKAGQLPKVRADIPLFRTLPSFDKSFNKGQECPMCHLMDKFQGVEIKSPLCSQEKKK